MTIKQLKTNLKSIKETIGWHDFPSEKDELLIQAFVRRSYAQEHPEWQHNQVLELIGDSVLDTFFIRKMCLPQFNQFGSFTKKHQFRSSKTEGELTEIKAKYVNGQELAKHIDNLELAHFLILGGADEKNKVRDKSSAKEDLFEAIIGAVALACNFQNEKIDFVCNKMLEFNKSEQKGSNKKNIIEEMRRLVGNKIAPDNSVMKLIELSRANFISAPNFSPAKESHDDNGNPMWECSASVEEYDTYWTCKRSTKIKAKQAAAYRLLKYTILGYKED